MGRIPSGSTEYGLNTESTVSAKSRIYFGITECFNEKKTQFFNGWFWELLNNKKMYFLLFYIFYLQNSKVYNTQKQKTLCLFLLILFINNHNINHLFSYSPYTTQTFQQMKDYRLIPFISSNGLSYQIICSIMYTTVFR